jgi:hypothetical protein
MQDFENKFGKSQTFAEIRGAARKWGSGYKPGHQTWVLPLLSLSAMF